jgi:hypothetical protein
LNIQEFYEEPLVLTTTNGTRLLHMALNNGAGDIIKFIANLRLCNYLLSREPVMCSLEDRVNIEDVVGDKIGIHFNISVMHQKWRKGCIMLPIRSLWFYGKTGRHTL